MTLTEKLQAIISEQEQNPFDGILHHKEKVDLVPSNLSLSSLEMTLVTAMSRESVLKNYLSLVKDKYDYVLIDCMPSLMADEMGGKDGWKIEKCFLVEDSREVADIIHGDFFIARSNVADEKYSSLSGEQLLKYKRLFRYPERFHETAHGIEIEPFKPDRADKER